MQWTFSVALAILTFQTIMANDSYKKENNTNFIVNQSNDIMNVNAAPGIFKIGTKSIKQEIPHEIHEDTANEEPVVERNSYPTIQRTDDIDENEEAIVVSDLTSSDVVLTEYGPVMGHVEDHVRRFFDIPYGKVDGIFQAPHKPDIKEELHDKLVHDVQCPQLSIDSDDTLLGIPDCLTLSVFTPLETHNASVLFHIHDGNIKVGSGDPTHYGPENIVSKDIIVILPNYRLGPLGFLCLGSDLAPGNAALKDLALALEWTVNNIANFGGNPNNIVVSGEGKSGALAGILALSEKTSQFVSKVITESGSFLSHLAIDRNPHVSAIELAENLNKDNDSTATEVIFETSLTELFVESKNLTFKPCIENGTDGIITESLWKTVSESVIDKKFMIGSANIAGYYKALNTFDYIESNRDWDTLIPEDLYFSDSGDTTKHEIASKIKNVYINSNITGSDEINIETLTLYHTDASYLGPDIRSARALINAGATVYFYEFSYYGETDSESDPRELLGGALKGDMMGFLFSKSGVMPIENPNDEEMVETLTQLWASFINTGVPTSGDIVWTKFEATAAADEPWLSIGAVVVPETGLHISRLALWTEIYDKYYIDRSGVARVQYDLPYLWLMFMYLLVFKI